MKYACSRRQVLEFELRGISFEIVYNDFYKIGFFSILSEGELALSEIISIIDQEYPNKKQFVWHACREYKD